MDATMGNDNNQTLKERHPEPERGERHSAPKGGGWVDYVEARLDMLERTRRLRALRLRRQASARQGGGDRPAKAGNGRR